MEHGLEYITFYVKKTYGIFGGLFWSPTGSRPATWGTRIYQSRLLKPELIYSFFLANTSLHVNSAYSEIGKVFPAVDMFLFSVKNQKDCTVVYNEIIFFSFQYICGNKSTLHIFF